MNSSTGKTKNGTWNGMVGMLLRNETDVVVAGLTYTKGRVAAIDYTVPVFPRYDKADKDKGCSLFSRTFIGTTTWLFFSRCRISLNGPRNKRAAPNYTVYVDRFTTVAWITIALAALVLAVAFAIVSQGRDSNVYLKALTWVLSTD